MYNRNRCVLIGAGTDSGQRLEGVSKAPDALRSAHVDVIAKSLKWGWMDMGNVMDDHDDDTPVTTAGHLSTPERDSLPATPPATPKSMLMDVSAKGFGGISSATIVSNYNRRLYERVLEANGDSDNFILTIGGDHGIAGATISAMLRKHQDLAVIWIDAHGDCNTPATSPTGSYHGMPLGHLMKWFEDDKFKWMKDVPILKEENVALIGLRDVDPAEAKLIANSNVAAFPMDLIDVHGIGKVVSKALSCVDPFGTRPIHLSFDIDVLDPIHAPGTGTRVVGGISWREAHCICEMVQKTGRLVSTDLVEINPLLEDEGSQTVEVGLDLIASILGKEIVPNNKTRHLFD
eukprot:GHVO01042238.1.p1 GENE.GHVO01042238.1~~GHVO01042238.1.p1  ORF type:complete len:358 (+),score=68.89 GHVO01042238.1:34-1074(+)